MDMTIRAMTPEERNYCYSQSQQISMQTGLIGHLRGDMGSNGKGFFSTFFDFRADLKTEDFKGAFDNVINALRFDENYGGVLKDRSALAAYCRRTPESSFGGDGREYGFRVDTEQYQLVENKQKFIAQIMTSKAPVRVADDVDETALSYSEIKALATGNPLIIEKCNLDMEVGKLNMLKASYLSQKYALEDMVLKKYPETITRLTERIAGYEQDLQLATAHRKPQEGFAGITILEQLYADKEAAGKAILDVCTKMTGSDAVFLGQYRGFSLVLSYDGPSNEYRMTMKGTLSHTAVLGADVFGNLTRMDNVIDGLSGKLEAVRAELADTQVQLENARTELAAPFAKEAELAEKTARLKELNILLNMDQKDKSLIDDVPDEDTPERSRSKGLER